jgi:hypothetical protein
MPRFLLLVSVVPDDEELDELELAAFDEDELAIDDDDAAEVDDDEDDCGGAVGVELPPPPPHAAMAVLPASKMNLRLSVGSLSEI